MAAAKLDKEKIKKQAKTIMDEFVKALSKIDDISGDVGLERKEATRAAKAEKTGKDFAARMLKNAPKSSEGQILAEKKSW